MAIKLDKEHFKEVDAAFADMLEGKAYAASCDKIARVLSSSFDKEFEVTVITPKRNDPFYIMSIFPTQSTVEKLVDSILNEESDKMLKKIWDENKEWTIEIDRRILTGAFVEANSKELTALILHECGHVIYSNSIPQRMSKVMKYEYAKADLGTKNVLKHGAFKKILELPIIKACIFENYKTDAQLKKELKADVFAVKMGYGDELDSVLTKIIATGSINKDTVKHIDQDSQDVYAQMKSDTLFSIGMVEDMKKREANVSKAKFHKMLLDLPSNYVKKAFGDIESGIFKGKAGKTDGETMENMEESANYLYEAAYTKEAFDVLKKKMKRLDPSTIDYINIRRNDIKNNDDKLMLVSYIHSKLDLIDYYLDIMDNPKYARKYLFSNSRNELVRMRSELERARYDIINYRIPEVRYGIQIMYPDGYEG